MAVRIRTTEKHPHVLWEKFITEFKVSEIQGFLLACSGAELEDATRGRSRVIPIQCLEAAEYDDDEELIPSAFFTQDEWENKISAAMFFESSLFFLTYKKGDSVLFRLFSVINLSGKITFQKEDEFLDEEAFISWWRSIKKIVQIKKTTEARERQDQTIFDSVIERHGYAWGGNMDGFLIAGEDNAVKAIIEVRQSRNYLIERYDPAAYFNGTRNKGGDFMTWLPLVYLKFAFNLPIVLITLSTKSGSTFGFTEVNTISKTKLHYKDDIPPTANITNDFDMFKKWLINIIK